jgi:hypothetical protein
MMNYHSNRDFGDEHAEPLLFILPAPDEYEYTFCSDHYDHTYVYAHGDAGAVGSDDANAEPASIRVHR